MDEQIKQAENKVDQNDMFMQTLQQLVDDYSAKGDSAIDEFLKQRSK